uniref:Uncharacterized protein n=1 Tax=viral metagenome TaxID=1070528 RepID=A0A6C0J4A8_9ZZZZ
MSSYLDYDNSQAMGNNQYQQSRMKIDPRFRMTNGVAANLTNVQGYSATGDILSIGDKGIADEEQTQPMQTIQSQPMQPMQTIQSQPMQPRMQRTYNERVMETISQIQKIINNK